MDGNRDEDYTYAQKHEKPLTRSDMLLGEAENFSALFPLLHLMPFSPSSTHLSIFIKVFWDLAGWFSG